jgi:hypothetical protein
MSDKQLASVCVFLSLVVMLLPGAAIEYISDLIKQLLPWRPGPSLQGPGHLDKLVHGLVFAVCAYSVTRAWLGERSLLTLALLLVLFAVFTELAQIYIPGRSGDVFDVLADGIGVTVGIVLALWWGDRQKKARR